MNDPTVVALLYRVEHGASVDYREAKPLRHDEPGFRVEINDGRARFEFKRHHATEQAARQAVEEYIRAWEFTAELQQGPDSFRLRFVRSEIKDRNPPPGMGALSVSARAGTPRATFAMTVVPACYPQPPVSQLDLTPDVESMHARFMGYRRRGEPLPGMAYFCLTILKYQLGKKAVEHYRISKNVLSTIARLSTRRGGSEARKAEGKDRDLTDQERRFLEEATRALIGRAAQKVPTVLRRITMSDLPRL